MDIIKLTTRPRTGTGKSYTRKARALGWVPAVFYGHGDKTQLLEINSKEFETICRNRRHTHIIDLGLEGVTDSNSIIKEIQKHVIQDTNFYHVDFQHINLAEKLHVSRKLVLTGTPEGVKAGGMLDRHFNTMRIECLPVDIPETLTWDISGLNINEILHVKDLSFPNIKILETEGELVATIHPPKVVEIVAVEEDTKGKKGKKK